MKMINLTLLSAFISLVACKKDESSDVPPVDTNTGKLVVPPSPGDLSSVPHLKQSNDYLVEVKRSGDANYTSCFVYKTDNYASNMYGIEKRPQTAASFTNVSFAGTSLDVRITCNFTASAATIRPLNYAITPVVAGKVITFTLKKPQKISVEVNNRLNPLFLFADTPDTANTAATYYYGPGVHNIGLSKVISSGQTVYIAGGAVLQGTFRIPDGSTNVEVRGRGIISNGALPTTEQRTNNLDSLVKYATFNTGPKFTSAAVSNSRFEGIIIANGSGWTFAISDVAHRCKNNSWRNLKQIQWSGNTDAIWFDGDNHVVDDCFIFNNDDQLTTHGSNNCTLSNLTIWGGNFGGHLFAQYQFGSSSGLLFENINLIGNDRGKETIVVSGNASPHQAINNITFRNIRMEDRPYKAGDLNATNKMISLVATNTECNNWLFENVTLDQRNPDEGDILGASTAPIKNIVFKNLKIAGVKINSLAESGMDINPFTTDLSFQ